jgi:hypothetical protein
MDGDGPTVLAGEAAMELHIYCGCSGSATGLPGHPCPGMPVADYIAWRREHEGAWRAELDSERYQLALRAVMTHPWYVTARAAPPAVHYNPDRDDVYYEFRTGAEGRTFYVSLGPVKGLERWATMPRLWHDYRVVEL